MTKNSPFELVGNNSKVWDAKEGDQYLVTGKDRNGKKFRKIYSLYLHAKSINLWEGRYWLLRDNKRYLISKVSN